MNLYRPTNIDWIMVQTTEQAENVPIQPNQRAWIMIQNEPVFALRTADEMGLAHTDFYKFEKYEPHPAAVTPQYVTIDDLKALEDRLNESISNHADTVTDGRKTIKHKTDSSDA